MYFLNMYCLFNLKSCIAELQAREDRVALGQILGQILTGVEGEGGRKGI